MHLIIPVKIGTGICPMRPVLKLNGGDYFSVFLAFQVLLVFLFYNRIFRLVLHYGAAINHVRTRQYSKPFPGERLGVVLGCF